MLSNLIFVYRDSPTFFPQKPFNSNSSDSLDLKSERTQSVDDLNSKQQSDLNSKEAASNRKTREGNNILCQICLQLFKTSGQRNKHSSYTTSKRYICHMYKNHNQTVEKEWFQCNKCSKYFPDQIYLFRHTAAVHKMGEKIHKCNFCPSAFSSKNRCRYHMEKFHKIGQGNKCCECDKYFSSEEGLTKHTIEIHKMIPANQINGCEIDEQLPIAQTITVPKNLKMETAEQQNKTDDKSRLAV